MDQCSALHTALAGGVFCGQLPADLLWHCVALSNRCGLPIVPTDLFPRELADITKVPYPRIKIGFDVTCLAITAGMTFFFLGRLEGLGIGTIAAAFTMGKGIGLVGDLLDKHFYFENYKTLRTAKNKQ